MKKILLLLLLVPFFGFAKYYEGTIYFSDGKNLTGLIEIPSITDKKINFKSSEKDKKQEFKTNDIDQLKITFGKDVVATYIATKHYAIKGFSLAKEPSVDKIWLQLIYDGKIKMYCDAQTTSNYSGGMASSSTNMNYFMKSQSKDYPQMVFTDFGGLAAGQFKYIKKAVEVYLKTDCPNIADLMIKEDIKEKGYTRIGELYDQNCGK